MTREIKRFVPTRVYIPLPEGSPVANGLYTAVERGETLVDGTDSLCCRASVDGLFKGMVGKSDAENHPIMAAMIQTDEQFALPDREEPAEFDAGRYPPEDILAAARQAGIIDEMDGRPLIDKLMEIRALGRLLVGDAVDDEPYLSSALGLLYARPLEVERGMALALHATGDGTGCYLVDATGTDREVGRIRMEKGRKVYRMRGTYPSRSRMAARMRPIGEPVFIGVAALLHLYRAVVYGDPHTTCFLTVAGDCIRFPANIEVPVGTLVEDILWFCGVGSKIDTLVVGGSMRAPTAVGGTQVPVGYTSRAVLAFGPRKEAHFACIGCGRCVDVCPVGLVPELICRKICQADGEGLEALEPERCIGCGACGYICPAKVDLVHYIMLAKNRSIPAKNLEGGERDADSDAAAADGAAR